MNKVFAIVVTYNPDEELLKQQFETLQGQVDCIIYVDNHSTSTAFIDALKNIDVTIIKNEDNLGLAKAQNQGIAHAKQSGASFVLLFDQDSVPVEGFVDALLTCFHILAKKEKVALIGPAIRSRYKGCIGNEKGIVIKGLGFQRVEVCAFTDVSYCIASGSLIPIRVLDEVGGMEEKLFIDGVDLEWCLRAKNFGYHIVQTNRTWLSHALGNGETSKIKSHSPQREYYIMRNNVWMVRQGFIPIGYRIRKIFALFYRLIHSLLCFDMDYLTIECRGVINGLML